MKNRNLQIYMLAWLVYFIFSMLGFPYMRITVMLFSIPLCMLGGWFYSYKGALVTTSLTIPYHYLLLNFHSDDPSILIEAINPFGIASLLVFSLGAALLKSNDQRYHKLNAELGHIVEKRTADLRTLADYLMNMQFIDRGIITSGLLDEPFKLLTRMDDISSLLYTSLEKQEHPSARNAKIAHQHIYHCMEKLLEFLREANADSTTNATLRENVEKISEKMIRLGGGKLNISMEGSWSPLYKNVTNQLTAIIGEAVANAIRHADPTEIRIAYQRNPQSTTICVENDGRTFPAHLKEGMGLPLMRHRAMSIGGILNIEGGPGQRTRVICRIPHPAAADKKLSQRGDETLNKQA